MIRLFTFFLFFIGTGLVIFSFKLPYYTDSKAKEKLESDANNYNLSNDGKSYNETKKKYYSAVDKLKTNKNFYFDFGSGIITTSLTVFLFLIIYKINNGQDLLNIKSFNKTLIFITAIAMWLLLIPGTYWYYSFRGERGDYPMFADSIAIPIFYNTIAIIISLIFLIFFLLLTTIKSRFPTLIFIKQDHYKNIDLFKEILWGLLMLLDLAFLISFVIDGDNVSIVVNLFFTYLILVLRAGQINARNNIYLQNQTKS